MAPNSTTQPDVSRVPGVTSDNNQQRDDDLLPDALDGKQTKIDLQWKSTDHIVWKNVIVFTFLHIAALYGVYLALTFQAKFLTILFAAIMYFMSGIGITAGCHRLWSHRSYKARLPLRIFLAFCQTIAVQNHIYEWVRDHRVHHKFAETDADPHNANRGFFFAHMGWLLSRKHPDVKRRGKTLDISDLETDPVVMFQKKYYWYLVSVISFIIPSLLPYYLWGETYIASYCIATAYRYCHSLHMTWLVNSAAHMFGNHPYDKNINPAENPFVAIHSFGEGWHNYHHTFPWDYKTSELGFQRLNLTAGLIELWYKLGLAYDLKSVPKDVIMKRVHRTGDGSHAVWGWGDKDLNEEEFMGNGEILKSE